MRGSNLLIQDLDRGLLNEGNSVPWFSSPHGTVLESQTRRASFARPWEDLAPALTLVEVSRSQPSLHRANSSAKHPSIYMGKGLPAQTTKHAQEVPGQPPAVKPNFSSLQSFCCFSPLLPCPERILTPGYHCSTPRTTLGLAPASALVGQGAAPSLSSPLPALLFIPQITLSSESLLYSPGFLQMGKVSSNEGEVGIFLHQTAITEHAAF